MADGKSYERAKAMRRALTPPEARLWVAVRKRASGLKVRKQHPVGPYILDFYIAECRLAVEVDGQMHADDAQAAHDARRDIWLAERGIRVMRVPAIQVRDDLAAVVEWLQREAGKADTVSPPPSRRLRRRSTSP